MSKDAAGAKTLAAQAIRVLCQDQETKDLSPQQISALHACKLAISAAIQNLYVTVDPEVADKILGKYMGMPK